ncbi:hypothetical protein M0208_05525 [Sphingomonas sp. SUN019]|uniref:ankyrin repeat domain-containing protein n=1 Tax=Sphingomonas sp. SUN019 TaxID=2937788 RepID=UPI002164719B|nr:hypothetical protein [Sphingomonas sp. SUN019]UVO50004.1 hypothetical protein M0208_05525 [Sphingomonas sp. SUN019]
MDEVSRAAFVDGADLPTTAELLGSETLGGSGRELVAALLARDSGRVVHLIDRDPKLLEVVAADRSMLEVAVATGDIALVDVLIAKGAALDGARDGGPLVLALHANAPGIAHALLTAGASPTPPDNPLAAFRAAIALGSAGGVRLLLDFGGDPDTRGGLDRRPLHIALDMEQFGIAELLMSRGADLWAVDAGGANLGTAVTTPMVTNDPAERDSQIRLAARAIEAGWPDPSPTPQAIRAMSLAGAWPPKR